MNKDEAMEAIRPILMKTIGPVLIKAIWNAKDETLKHFLTLGNPSLWKTPNPLEILDTFARALINSIQKEYIPPFTQTEDPSCDSKND